MFEQLSHSKHALLHVSSKRVKNWVRYETTKLLGIVWKDSTWRTTSAAFQNANKSFKNATNSSIITGFLKTDPELQHVCVFGTLTASFNGWLAAVRNVFAVSPNDP